MMLTSLNLFAFPPVDGFWWNPDESGRGLTIEIQNGVLVAALYAYDDNNNGRWYLGSGAFDEATNTANGTWDAYDGGQCSGCPYTSPSINSSFSKGAFTLTFITDVRASMQWSGGVMNLEKFDYTFPDQKSYLYGVWTATMFYSFAAYSESFYLNGVLVSDGDEFVTGKLWGGSPDRVAVANVFEVDVNGEATFSYLIDVSSSYYRLYITRTNKNKMSGLGWLYRKGESPTGDGATLLGTKFLDNVAVGKNSPTANTKNDSYYDNIYNSTTKKGKFNSKYLEKINKMEQTLSTIKGKIK